MDNRRDFLKKAALLSSSSLLSNTLPPVIQKALAVAPEVGSTFYDAEHIVFLMQENRSFDHQLGMLQGVRGFNDPRAIQLPDQNTVWLQTNAQGDTYGPFHLNVKDTKVAWMGSLPHGWTDQTDAMNNGKYDKWLDTKKARNKAFNDMPLTMGYCDREDFPFYYSLADAFTVCDHNFCSSITGTHPNRHYWMTGTVREKNEPEAIAHLWNVNNYEYPTLNWTTYPERLQAAGVPWKVYQNEITMGYGLKGEESAWLSNFGTNVLEYYQQYNVRLHEGGIANLQAKNESVRQLIAELEKQPADEKTAQKLAAARKLLTNIETAQRRYTTDGYANLPEDYVIDKKFMKKLGDVITSDYFERHDKALLNTTTILGNYLLNINTINHMMSYQDPTFIKVVITNLIEEILSAFKSKAKEVTNDLDKTKSLRKLINYSCHDTNLTPLLFFMGLLDFECHLEQLSDEKIRGCSNKVPYSSSIIFELVRDLKDNSVNVFTRFNGRYYYVCEGPTKPVKMACPLNKFISTMSKAVFENKAEMREFCGIPEPKKQQETNQTPNRMFMDLIKIPAIIAAVAVTILVWRLLHYRSLANNLSRRFTGADKTE